MTRIILGWVAIIFLLSSCHSDRGKKTTITGTLSDAPGIRFVLQEMDIREIKSIDSIVAGDDGAFRLELRNTEAGFWLLKAPSGKILVILLHPGEQVELTGSAREFPENVLIKGAKDAMLLNAFFRYTQKNERMIDSLEMLLVERQDSSDYYPLTQKLDTIFRLIWERQRMYERAFIGNHPGSLASLIVLNYAFGLSAVLNPDEDFDCFAKLDSTLMSKYPENKHVKFHHKRVTDHRQKKLSGN